MVLGLSVLLLASCANVDKLIDEADYESALNKSARKLSGKKNKKVKHVQWAEEAFLKVTNRDVRRMEELKIRGRIEDWKKIISITRNIDRRQELIEPLLPLVAQNGYEGNFSFVKTSLIAREARRKVSTMLYDEANILLTAARRGDHVSARDAFYMFEDIQHYMPGFKKSISLMNESETLGMEHIIVTFKNQSNAILPRDLSNELKRFYYQGRQNRWVVFHHDHTAPDKVDWVSEIIINQINISPERMSENRRFYEKDIQEEQFARDQYGEFVRDTAGKRIRVYVTQTVSGEVLEVEQDKEAVVSLTVQLVDADTKQVVDTDQFSAHADFHHIARRVFGDRRAIPENNWEFNEPLPFPSDADLLLTAVDELKLLIRDYISVAPIAVR